MKNPAAPASIRLPALLRILHVCFTTLLLSTSGIGCSASVSPDEPKEIKSTTVKTIDTPEAKLFLASKDLYSAGLYTVAKDSFQSLRDTYPLGPYAEFAEIKIADCSFETKDYEVSAPLYEEFLKNHPTSRAAPYVLMRAGLTTRLLSRGPGRDGAALEKAKQFFDSFLEKYPDSVYIDTVRRYREEAVRDLHTYEKLVARFYKKKGNKEAYEARKEYAEAKWGSQLAKISQSEERVALEVPEGDTVDAANIPLEDPTDRVAVAAMVSPPVTPPTPKNEKISKAAKNQPAADANALYQIEHVECSDNDGRKVFLYLNRPFADREFLKSSAHVSAQGGIVSLTLPNTSSLQNGGDCFAKGELSISKQGKIELRSSGDAALFALNNPPRLLVATK